MPLRAQRPVSRSLHEKLVQAYAQEAARLRELATSVTTTRLRSRLLEEADNQERLAQQAKRGIIHPEPVASIALVVPGQIERRGASTGLIKRHDADLTRVEFITAHDLRFPASFAEEPARASSV